MRFSRTTEPSPSILKLNQALFNDKRLNAFISVFRCKFLQCFDIKLRLNPPKLRFKPHQNAKVKIIVVRVNNLLNFSAKLERNQAKHFANRNFSEHVKI